MFRIAVILILFLFQKPFSVKSPDFANGHYIQLKFTCDGTNRSPGLNLENIPKGTVSFALIMDDIDSPNGEFVHWVMWNMPVVAKIKENAAQGVVGKNTHGQNKYFGPCPPNGLHNYHFKVYALNTKLSLDTTAGKNELLTAMKDHILAQAELTGKYARR